MTIFKAFQKVAAVFAALLAVLALSVAPALAAGPAPFGLKFLKVSETEAPAPGQEPNGFGEVLGPADVQAGSHPYALTTTFVLNPPEETERGLHHVAAGKGLKDVRVETPPGFVGNPNATPKCSYHEYQLKACPNDTVIGVATTVLSNGKNWVTAEHDDEWYDDPIYNLEPRGGVPAEFAYYGADVTPVFLDAAVRTGGDYGITINVRDIPEIQPVLASIVTIWGVPAEASHNKARGTCLTSGNSEQAYGVGEPGENLWEFGPHNDETSQGECPVNVPVEPLLTNPTSCGESRTATMSVDDWGDPGNFATGENVYTKATPLPVLSGCGKLDFSPSLNVTPDGAAGSTPTGLNVHLRVPQGSTTNPEGLGEADVRDTTVALPPGVQISPSASDGLQACSPAQIGFKGVNPQTGTDEFTSTLPGSIDARTVGDTEPLQPGVNFCPNASKIASVRIATPLLEHELTGAVYLAAPQNFLNGPLENPFGSLIAMYLVAEEPVTGVLVKVAGKVSLNETTGQITTTFENTPELPYSELELEFYGTARAPLATPALCGTYKTESSFVSWNGGVRSPASEFAIASGPELQGTSGLQKTPCSDPLPFAPSLSSGTTNIQSGAYSELTTTLSREDGDQNIQQVTLHYPPGLTGLLSGVELCGEAQANAGSCGPNSQIGESIVSVGLGSDPFTVVGGKVYITGPYEGAPFGLSIVNPAKAGPYVLQEGRPVVVRAKVEVNPYTAALTVTTNGGGDGRSGTGSEVGYAIPHIIDGIPLNIKHVNVLVNRPDFTINPTNCDKQQITGSVESDEGASSPVSISSQVTNCGALKFAPTFTVSTNGKTSKSKGASLTTTVTYPSAAAGTYANVSRVKVELPKALPSRLTTLQKACTDAQFNANPAGCPSESKIGYAVVHTPLLPVPLEGPAIFVSHGGEAFPSLTMVLQGYGVTVDLVGTTFISKAGVTSTTFKTLPDSPFSSFTLTLPEGPYSALAANGNLCVPTTTKTVEQKVTVKIKGHKMTKTRKVTESVPTTLTMPNEFVAQNGTVIKQTTTIAVTGCAKAKPAKEPKKKKKKTKKGKRK